MAATRGQTETSLGAPRRNRLSLRKPLTGTKFVVPVPQSPATCNRSMTDAPASPALVADEAVTEVPSTPHRFTAIGAEVSLRAEGPPSRGGSMPTTASPASNGGAGNRMVPSFANLAEPGKLVLAGEESTARSTGTHSSLRRRLNMESPNLVAFDGQTGTSMGAPRRNRLSLRRPHSGELEGTPVPKRPTSSNRDMIPTDDPLALDAPELVLVIPSTPPRFTAVRVEASPRAEGPPSQGGSMSVVISPALTSGTGAQEAASSAILAGHGEPVLAGGNRASDSTSTCQSLRDPANAQSGAHVPSVCTRSSEENLLTWAEATVCTLCSRSFRSPRACSLHVRSKHSSAYYQPNEQNLLRKHRRWDTDERTILAEEDIRLTEAGARGRCLLRQLWEYMPPRSFEAVKGQLRQPEYRRIRANLLARTPTADREPAQASRASSGTTPPGAALDATFDGNGDPSSRVPLTGQTDRDNGLTDTGNALSGQPVSETNVREALLMTCLEASPLLGLTAAEVAELDTWSRAQDLESGRKVQERVDNVYAAWLNTYAPDAVRTHDALRQEPARRCTLSRWVGSRRRARARKNHSIRQVVRKANRRRTQYARVQRVYRANRSRCADLVLSGDWAKDPVPVSMAEQEAFWKPLMETPSVADGRSPDRTNEVWEILLPVTINEYRETIKRVKDSAPGEDTVCRSTIRGLSAQEVTAQFNLWLLCGCPPTAFGSGVTCPIPKSADATDPAEFRPITISPMICRVFHNVLARRFESDLPMSPRQKAFCRGDGLADNVYLLRSLITDSQCRHRNLSLCFLDVRKAFDSVSHESILTAATRLGMPSPLISYIRRLYSGSATRLRINGRLGSWIHPRRGVRQGDPMSPFLFNAVVDWALSSLDPNLGIEVGNGIRLNHLAFADDIALLTGSKRGLQRLVSQFETELGLCGLSLNPAKSASLCLLNDGKAKRGYVDPEPFVRVGNALIPTLGVDDVYKYLGVGMGARPQPSPVNTALARGLEALTRAPLKPQQRLYFLRTHLLPKFTHSLVLNDVRATHLKALDVMTRAAVRRWLRLPKDVPLAFFHAPIGEGGLGIQQLTYRIPFLRANRIQRLANRAATGLDPVLQAMSVRSNALRQRIALGIPTLRCYGQSVTSKDEVTKATVATLLCSCDGAGLRSHGRVKGHSDWLLGNERAQSGKDFVHAVQVRANCLFTAERAARGAQRRNYHRACDACGRVETLGHILQVCPRSAAARTDRHNRVCDLLMRQLQREGFLVTQEPSIPTPAGLRRPDLIVYKPGLIATVMDVTVVSDNANLDESHEKKVMYYDRQAIRAHVAQMAGIAASDVLITAVAFNWRGAVSRLSWLSLIMLGLTRGALRTLSLRVLENGYRVYSEWKNCTWRETDTVIQRNARNSRTDIPGRVKRRRLMVH